MKAAGISLYRVSAPILVIGLLVAVGAALFQELVLPRLNELGMRSIESRSGQEPRHLRRARGSGCARIHASTGWSWSPQHATSRHDRAGGRSRLPHATGWTPSRRCWSRGLGPRNGASRQISPRPGGDRAVHGDHRRAPESIEDLGDPETPHGHELSRTARLRDRLETAGFQVGRYLVDLHAKLSSPSNLIMV
jgi:hypothetical protein